MALSREPGRRRGRLTLNVALGVGLVALALCGAAFLWRGAIWRSMLDPKTPYPAYRPPTAPDYARKSSWALWPSDASRPDAGAPPADVFFIAPALGMGGRDWNTPIADQRAQALLQQVVLPNYAGPFARAGRVFAPRYRAAALFAYLTLRDDARDARVFAYGDVRAAFAAMLRAIPPDRPILIAGVGEGAELAVRLVQDKVLGDPAVSRRVAAVYLVNAVVPLSALPASGPLSPCRVRRQARCTVGWARVPEGRLAFGHRRQQRALAWTPSGGLANTRGPFLCVNPLTGGTSQPSASSKANLGAADATDLEWGARPAVLPHEVSAVCEDGLLVTSRPATPSLQRQGWGLFPRLVAPLNLFYADTEADARARLEAYLGHSSYSVPAPPITDVRVVAAAPIHRID